VNPHPEVRSCGGKENAFLLSLPSCKKLNQSSSMVKGSNSNKIIIIIISKSLRQYLGNLPGKHEIKEIQKTAILGTHTYCGKY